MGKEMYYFSMDFNFGGRGLGFSSNSFLCVCVAELEEYCMSIFPLLIGVSNQLT